MASTSVEVIRAKFEALKPVMNERTRRLWAATEARAIAGSEHHEGTLM
jgi:hypothetical protein